MEQPQEKLQQTALPEFLKTDRVRGVRTQTRAVFQSIASVGFGLRMTERLTLQELEEVPKKTKQKKAPGPDGIPNEMLQHLGSGTKCILLFIYSQNWSKGKVPTMWNEVLIRSIPKKGKEK